MAAIGFALEYAIGGNDAVVARQPSAASMIGVHVLIGIGEGIITAIAVGAVMAMRPDLVYGARGIIRPEPASTASPARGQLRWIAAVSRSPASWSAGCSWPCSW